MSVPQFNHSGYTIDEWKTWEGRWELINGVPYDMTPAPNVEHQRTSSRLHGAIFHLLKEGGKTSGGECEVFAAPIDVFLPNEESVYQPDLVIVCDPSKVAPHGIVGVPDLVVEILSPSTATRDLWHKRNSYETAGIPEYLIVDPEEKKGLLLRLEGGRYLEVAQVPWGSVVGLLGGKLSVTLD